MLAALLNQKYSHFSDIEARQYQREQVVDS